MTIKKLFITDSILAERNINIEQLKTKMISVYDVLCELNRIGITVFECGAKKEIEDKIEEIREKIIKGEIKNDRDN